ncbi:D-isomer specific 2-hydroxyacid dehydrogenase [Poronia punctata]|nr:D-isomer specific 2-hydroxyacid dehydrogenase [Poronia punctata]
MDDALILPKQLPSPTHQVIVVLEAVHLPITDIDTTPQTHELISYHKVHLLDEIRDRIQCASIVVTAQALITAESLGDAPYLKYIVTPTAGLNHVDLEECRRRGIKVSKCPGSTSLAVPEHALSLYFAARRKTIILHSEIRSTDTNGANSWKREHSIAYKMQTANGQPPLSLEQEVAGIIGYGHIGKRLKTLCEALGMKVIIINRKNNTTQTETDVVPRVPFEQGIKSVSVLFICSVFNASTLNMIDTAELALMRRDAIIVNVSRAGVMCTEAVIRALRENRISGAAMDVFDNEPASNERDSAFLAEDTRDLNLTFSPHVGYFSTKTVTTMKAMVKDNIKKYIAGEWDDFVV